MGNNQSQPQGFSDFLQNYQKRETLNDDRFGQVTIYNHAHNPTEQIMVKDRWTNTPTDAAELAGMSRERVQNNHKNLAKLLQYGTKEENQMCSTFYKHFMAVEYYPKNLEQEIQDKNSKKGSEFYAKYYSEPEVWYIMDALFSLLSSFVSHDYHHGDIQPKNIFIDPHGYIKLCDNSLINYSRTGYLKMIFENGYHAALSPQLLQSIKSQELHPHHDPVKSDIFSIGITMLCAALNTSIERYYNYAGVPTLNQEAINASYDKMNELGFSHQLVSTIQGFLDPIEERRTNLRDMNDFLHQYQDAIRGGKMNFGQGVPTQGGFAPSGYQQGGAGFPRQGAAVPAYGSAAQPQPTFATSSYGAAGAQQFRPAQGVPGQPISAAGQRQQFDSRFP